MSASVQKPRILFIDHTAKMGGGEIALRNLIAHIGKDYEPIVLLLSDGPLRQALEQAGVTTFVMPLARAVSEARKDSLFKTGLIHFWAAASLIPFILRLRKFIRASGARIVHTNSLKSDVIGGLGARLARVPVVWHVRDRIADDYLPPMVAKVFRILCGWLPHRVIANSAATLKTLGSTATEKGSVIASGFDPSRTLVVHDGVAPPRMGGSSEIVGTPTVGLIGRLAPWKGQNIFLDAAERVLQKFPNARFQLIGSALFGEEAFERQLRQQVVRQGLEHAVEFCGFCENIGERIAQLTILAHASIIGEPFGQVVIEGMAAEKPVVATNGGGIPEIVVEGVTGLLVPMKDATAMADAICKLLDNPAMAREMGRRGRQRVSDYFTIEQSAQKVMQVYAQLLQRDAARAESNSEKGGDAVLSPL